MKTIELSYLPGDTCWVRGQHRVCYIESVTIERDLVRDTSGKSLDVTYTWYNLDHGVDIIEVWDDGYFNTDDIGKTVFDTYEELVNAFPEDFNFGDTYE